MERVFWKAFPFHKGRWRPVTRVLGLCLFAVIDTVDPMTSDRPYRPAQFFIAAKAEILRAAGTQFDPVAVTAIVAEAPGLREMVSMECTQAEIHYQRIPAWRWCMRT